MRDDADADGQGAPARVSPARRSATAAARAARRTWWRVLDYAFVVRRQAVGLVRPGRPDPGEGSGADVVLVPGVYEPWHFLRPLAHRLRAAGHRVHAVPTLGYNRRSIIESAEVLRARVRELDGDVVVVAHSKGGLIGKLAMLDAEGARIRHLVAIATPFEGSRLARAVPLRAVRAFVPTDATLVALTAEREVNARITSVYSCWDPHIPTGSVLPGAAGNVEVRTPGHFRVLEDPVVTDVVLRAAAEAADERGAPTHAGHVRPTARGGSILGLRSPFRGARRPPRGHR